MIPWYDLRPAFARRDLHGFIDDPSVKIDGSFFGGFFFWVDRMPPRTKCTGFGLEKDWSK